MGCLLNRFTDVVQTFKPTIQPRSELDARAVPEGQASLVTFQRLQAEPDMRLGKNIHFFPPVQSDSINIQANHITPKSLIDLNDLSEVSRRNS